MGGLYRVYIGLHRDSGKEYGNYYNGLYRVYIGVYIGIMEKKMKINIMG